MRSSIPFFAYALALSAPAIAAEAIPVGGFRSVELRGGGSVSVVPGAAQRVTIVEGSSQITRIYVDARGKLRIDACSNRCPQQYKLRIQIQTPRVPDLAISGGGSMVTQGRFGAQPQLSTAINGGGRIDARAVPVSNVSAAVNGGGELMVRSSSILSAAINGGGIVRYWGNPRVSSAIRGGGVVRPGN